MGKAKDIVQDLYKAIRAAPNRDLDQILAELGERLSDKPVEPLGTPHRWTRHEFEDIIDQCLEDLNRIECHTNQLRISLQNLPYVINKT